MRNNIAVLLFFAGVLLFLFSIGSANDAYANTDARQVRQVIAGLLCFIGFLVADKTDTGPS